MNFEGQQTIKTGCGICCSTWLIINFLFIFSQHLWSMCVDYEYLDLDEYTLEEQDRGFSEYELTNY